MAWLKKNWLIVVLFLLLLVGGIYLKKRYDAKQADKAEIALSEEADDDTERKAVSSSVSMGSAMNKKPAPAAPADDEPSGSGAMFVLEGGKCRRALRQTCGTKVGIGKRAKRARSCWSSRRKEICGPRPV